MGLDGKLNNGESELLMSLVTTPEQEIVNDYYIGTIYTPTENWSRSVAKSLGKKGYLRLLDNRIKMFLERKVPNYVITKKTIDMFKLQPF